MWFPYENMQLGAVYVCINCIQLYLWLERERENESEKWNDGVLGLFCAHAKLGQADAGDNEAKLMTKLALSGFELATQWSEAQPATAGLRRPPSESESES